MRILLLLFILVFPLSVDAATIGLVWDQTPRATGYKVYRALKPCNQIKNTKDPKEYTLISTAVLTPQYTDTTVPSNASHICYAVSAYNTAGDSPLSQPAEKAGPGASKNFNLN